MGNQHAVVLGASMAGLLSARALSNHFEQVTVIERDKLPEGPELRKGVPQAAHAHGLLASGYRIMDGYFPGMMDSLCAAGAPRGDVANGFLWFQYGHWKLRHESGLGGITVSRPALEAGVRAGARARPNIRFIEEADGEQPAFDPETGRVAGIALTHRATGTKEAIAADLVVDASGRGSQAPRWLEEWGFGQPEEEVVRVDVGYATRVFKRSEGDLYGANGAIIAGSAPETRYAAILAAEGPRWVVTLAGMLGDYPPSDAEGWQEYARTLPTNDTYDLVTRAEPLSGIVTYRFPANQRRRYERMKRFPAGFLAVGDAVCSFNPIYGQGMSVAASEAALLDECLRSPGPGLAETFYKRAAKIVDIPWVIATGEDLRYPQVAGKRPPGTKVVNRYLERLHAVAAKDPVVAGQFFQVLNLLAPPTSLMKPGIARRVLFSRPPAGPGSPALTGAAARV